MKIQVFCEHCLDHHFDHFECSECGHNFGFLDTPIKYCPECGAYTKAFKDHDDTVKDVDIVNCARCGGNHKALTFKRMERPVQDSDGLWTHWSLCPVERDPILFQFVEDE